jgi:hypothetical protein
LRCQVGDRENGHRRVAVRADDDDRSHDPDQGCRRGYQRGAPGADTPRSNFFHQRNRRLRVPRHGLFPDNPVRVQRLTFDSRPHVLRRCRKVGDVLRAAADLNDVSQGGQLLAALGARVEVCPRRRVGLLVKREKRQLIGIQMRHGPPPIACVAWTVLCAGDS